MAWSTARWSSASSPQTASAISPLTLATACRTPLPEKRSPPSRSSTASRMPVEAPEGAMARPRAPESRSTSASTVGLPRESRTSRPITCSMVLTTSLLGRLPWWDTRGTTLAVAHLVFGDALGCENVRAQGQRAVAQRLFRVDAEPLGQRWPPRRAVRPLQPARPRRHRPADRPPADRPPGRAGSVRPASRPPARHSRGPAPGRRTRALRASLVVSISAGRPAGMPSVTLLRPFSLFLIASQLVTTSAAVSASTSPNTWGCRCTSLSCTPQRHVGQVELTGLARQAGMEDDLEEQVPQLLLQMRVAPSASKVPAPGSAPRPSLSPASASRTS